MTATATIATIVVTLLADPASDAAVDCPSRGGHAAPSGAAHPSVRMSSDVTVSDDAGVVSEHLARK
jgi:hypothetical protein